MFVGLLSFGSPAQVAADVSVNPYFEMFTVVSDGSGNAYPSIATLPGGRLLCVWSAGGNILGAFSTDGGKTWPRGDVIIGTDERDVDPQIVLAQSEVQVYSTTVPLSYGNKVLSCKVWKTTYSYEADKWSGLVLVPKHKQYYCGMVSNSVRLPGGQILRGYAWDIPSQQQVGFAGEGKMDLKSGVLISGDNGETWQPSEDIWAQPPKTSKQGTGGVCEPSMVLLADDSVYMLLRTADKYHWQSRSDDGGKTWSTPNRSPLTGHNTPSAMCRLKDSGDVVVVWNNDEQVRWPLSVALSSDNCHCWSKPKVLVNTPGSQCSYPGITQADDGAIIVVWQQDRTYEGRSKQRDICGVRFDRKWLLDH